LDQKVHAATRSPLQQRLLIGKESDRKQMDTALEAVTLLSLVNASISFTVSEMKIFRPLREWVKCRNHFLGELLFCGYCVGHWTAFALVAIYRPRLFELWWPLDYFLSALVIAWLSAFQWIVLCWLMQKTGK